MCAFFSYSLQKSGSTGNKHNRHVPPQNQLSYSSQSVNDNEDLFLKPSHRGSKKMSVGSKQSEDLLHHHHSPTDNTHRTSSLVQSPSETFGTIFQPISHTHTSPHNRSLPNSVINSTAMGFMGSSSGPERLFSASRLLNQRVNNISSPKTEVAPEFTNMIKGSNDAADSDGSEHSQLSNASKISSLSGQSEFLKGANNLNMNGGGNKKLSNLTQSDGNRYTTVVTNASTTTTTTQAWVMQKKC